MLKSKEYQLKTLLKKMHLNGNTIIFNFRNKNLNYLCTGKK